jgi:aspartyl protease family protein
MKKPLLTLCLVLGLLSLHPALLAVEQIRVMALFPNKAMVSVDGTNRLLAVGSPSPEGLLLITADSQEAVIELDGRQQSYPLGSHIQTNFARPESLEARIWRIDSGSYTTVGSINGRTAKMLVDTGATSVSMNAVQARRLGIRYRSEGKEVAVNTVAGKVRGYAVKLDRVRVGRIELKDIDAIVIDGENPPDVLLGMTFLNQVSMRNQGELLTLRSR